MSPDALLELDRRHVWHPFTQALTAPPPIPIVQGKGAVLTAADGREYLDLISSWWVNINGHAHPAIAGAVAEQAARLEQVIFAGFTHEPAVTLAKRLTEVLPSGLDKVFFSDDGSTAVEVALKIAVQYWDNRGEQRTRILAFDGGYHGDTVGAMSAGRGSGFFEAFAPLLFPVDRLPFPATWDGDTAVTQKEADALAALDAHLHRYGQETAALIVEPLVQGAAGMRMCRPEFLRAISGRLRAAGVLLVFDEVMTGFGRTGHTFACEGAGVTPDLICLSKGLTGGYLPLSVTVCGTRLYEAFLDESFDKALIHGHSFTANPLGCAAALASLELLESPETRDRIAAVEAHHRLALNRLRDHPRVAHTRLTGTIAAMDITGGGEGYRADVGPRLKADFLDQGLLIRPLGNVVYLMPPYCTTEEQLGRGYAGIEAALERLG